MMRMSVVGAEVASSAPSSNRVNSQIVGQNEFRTDKMNFARLKKKILRMVSPGRVSHAAPPAPCVEG